MTLRAHRGYPARRLIMVTRAPVYFTDENTLGQGKLLRRAGREDVVCPGHEELSEVPVGTPDLDWMPVVAQRDLIVVMGQADPRARPAELRAYCEHGIRSVWIGAKQDLGPRQRVELFLQSSKSPNEVHPSRGSHMPPVSRRIRVRSRPRPVQKGR